MPSENDIQLDRELMLTCLKEVAKEYHKQFKGGNIEIIIVGGASLAMNYNFRPGTTDIDAFIVAREDLKDIINKIGDKYNLPNGWLNQDFKYTDSYSPNIRQYSKYYASYSHCMEVRTIKDEYLIAMKLASYRPYKHDRSDIIGIIIENDRQGRSITFDKVDKAVRDLYGNWNKISVEAKLSLKSLLAAHSLETVYDEITKQEQIRKNTLINFEEKYPGILSEDNVSDIVNCQTPKEDVLSVDDLIAKATEKVQQSNSRNVHTQSPSIDDFIL